MEPIKSDSFSVYFDAQSYTVLEMHLNEKHYSKIFLLTDTNTERECVPIFKKLVPEAKNWISVVIPAGEPFKTIETCLQVWNSLSELGADRKSLLVNLGGGVVTDLGGFVASTYQRGINFINIPTTLLSMVDASIGGKTGVDLGTLKNQIGVINQPELVLVDSVYLKTLSSRELRSGFAEMLKHGLIQDSNYWNELKNLKPEEVTADQIYTSVQIKNEVVQEDPTEQNLRKILNFGHTLGHAIESYFLNSETDETLLHGEAIALGMILEAYLSIAVCGLSKNESDAIKSILLNTYPRVEIGRIQQEEILKLLRFDKKNAHGKVYFSLLEKIGYATYNKEVTDDLMFQAFEYYSA
jgi:3-dehydroquinate synthase